MPQRPMKSLTLPHRPARRPGRRLPLLAVALAAALAAAGCHAGPRARRAAASSPRRATPSPPPPTEHLATIPRGIAWSPFLERTWHFSAAEAQATVAAARPVFNLSHVQAGHSVSLWTGPLGQPVQLRYAVDREHTLVLTPASGMPGGGWQAELRHLHFVTLVAGVSGTLEHSLFAAVEAAGEGDVLALKLARIFGYDLDFYTDPRPGDSFRVVIEKRYRHGQFGGYGPILAAEYVNAGHAYQAVRFHDAQGLPGYYRPDGQPLKREFLRSPLKFVALRVTSPFSHDRFHPILKIWRPHLGVDYGAPMGTPVQAIGNGLVVFAGRDGGAGNMVKLRHANGYQTLYLHLSIILVRIGEHVRQGQTIGRVGMTGLATGPHLDFRITHFGVYENFQKLRQRLPPAAPVPAELRAAFAARCRRWLGALHRLGPHTDAVLQIPPLPATASGN